MPNVLDLAPAPSKRDSIREIPTALCFIERETRLHGFDAEAVPGENRYAQAFAHVMDGLSCPYEITDLLLGGLVEGPLPPEAPRVESAPWLDCVHSSLLFGPGHMTLDYAGVVSEGLSGILYRVNQTAAQGGEREQVFAANARICVGAIRNWVARYLRTVSAQSPPSAPAVRAAGALRVSPLFPATDFHSALQGCWIVHLLVSGVAGGRDYGFGRLDQILWPFLKRDLESGSLNEDGALALIEDFFLKLNRLAGNGRGYPDLCGFFQPTPCTGTKQYIVLGGRNPDGTSAVNLLSRLFLRAVGRIGLREPVLHVRYHPDDDADFRQAAVEASIASQGQVQFANEVFTVPALTRRGVATQDAFNYGASACSRLDLGALHGNGELWTLPTEWLRDAIAEAGEPRDFEELLTCFQREAERSIQNRLEEAFPDEEPLYDKPFTNEGGLHFHIESLFLRDCVARGRHLCEGGGRYRLHLVCFVGIATLINSLLAIREIVFRQRRLTLQAFDAIVRDNFQGHESLRELIRDSLTKFGDNTPEADDLTERVGRMLVDAVEAVPAPADHITIGCFYSLIVHLWAGKKQPATWDGRLAGEPLSENQSPVYGGSQPAPTALLNSLSRLPFDRAISGSLNLLFPASVPPQKVRALLDVFFRTGGSMVGLTFADREKLEDAMAHPGRHPFLQVRMHGFSEYFVNMPREEQEEVLARTSL